MSTRLDSTGPGSVCQAALEGDNKWLLIVGNDTVRGGPATSESSCRDQLLHRARIAQNNQLGAGQLARTDTALHPAHVYFDPA